MNKKDVIKFTLLIIGVVTCYGLLIYQVASADKKTITRVNIEDHNMIKIDNQYIHINMECDKCKYADTSSVNINVNYHE